MTLSQVQPQEKTQKELRKETKLIILTGPRVKKHGMPAIWGHTGKHQGGQEAEDRSWE